MHCSSTIILNDFAVRVRPSYSFRSWEDVFTFAGLIIGGMLGSFFLRSARKWPLFLGGGTGVGMAYANCEKSLNEYLLSLEPDPCLIKKQA
ncbi:MICOS complex subunit Mic10-like isoform X1 [Cydia strobilella]|uniref:MICOS complex subunit Mic10-like isoform X1 n=1 Tax=Cydia strobilella TaxID=1100964 RepID=UPI0030072CD7